MAFISRFRTIVLCAFGIFFNFITYGQTTVSVAGKIYTIPAFNDDTLTLKERYLKEDSLLIAYKFTMGLAQSKDDFEARCFVKTAGIGNRFILIILKGNKYKLLATLYDCRYVAMLADGTPGIKLEKYQSIWIQSDQRRINLKTDTNFTRLVELGLFNYPDKKFFQGGKDTPTMEDAFHSDYVVEIKLNGKYHSFRYDPNLLKSGPGNKRLIDGKSIINAFFDLAKCRRLI